MFGSTTIFFLKLNPTIFPFFCPFCYPFCCSYYFYSSSTLTSSRWRFCSCRSCCSRCLCHYGLVRPTVSQKVQLRVRPTVRQKVQLRVHQKASPTVQQKPMVHRKASQKVRLRPTERQTASRKVR